MNKQNKLRYKLKSGEKQQGFVLILTLVLLAVLTLIGVSSMNSANMEVKVTANAKQHQIAFNAVQALLEFSVSPGSDGVFNFQVFTPGVEQALNTYTVTGGSNLSSKAEYVGCGAAEGNSLQAGKGFSYNFFNITGTGFNAAGLGTGSASSVQVQGVRVPAASCL